MLSIQKYRILKIGLKTVLYGTVKVGGLHGGKKRNHVLLTLRSFANKFASKTSAQLFVCWLIRPIYGVLPFSSVYQ